MFSGRVRLHQGSNKPLSARLDPCPASEFSDNETQSHYHSRLWSASMVPAPVVPHEIPLIEVRLNQAVLVSRIECGEEDSIRLKRMGIHPGRELRVLQRGNPLILRVVHSRLGLSRQLASGIFVHAQPLETD